MSSVYFFMSRGEENFSKSLRFRMFLCLMQSKKGINYNIFLYLMTLLKIYHLSRFFKSHYSFHFIHRYPQCLHFLELLQYEHFRRELVNPACAKFIDEQQILHWQYYSRKRMKINLPKSSGQTGSTTEGEPSWNCKLCRKKCGQDVSTEMANN